jgi:nucleotide-binding universal stress UspA family protein
MRHILTPTDFSEPAAAALQHAVELAKLSGARLTLLHVLFTEKITEELLGLDALEYLSRSLNAPPQDSPYSPEACVARLRESAQQKLQELVAASANGVAIATQVVEGRPSTEVVEFAAKNDVDLIVMGTQGRSGLGRALLGSVADHVIRQADCPVMVVRK